MNVPKAEYHTKQTSLLLVYFDKLELKNVPKLSNLKCLFNTF